MRVSITYNKVPDLKIIEVVEALPLSWGNINGRLHATRAMLETNRFDPEIKFEITNEPGFRVGNYGGGTFEQLYSSVVQPQTPSPVRLPTLNFSSDNKLPMAIYLHKVGVADARTDSLLEDGARRQWLFETGRIYLLDILQAGYKGDFNIGSVMHPSMWRLSERIWHAEEIDIQHHHDLDPGARINLYADPKAGGKAENLDFLIDLLKDQERL